MMGMSIFNKIKSNLYGHKGSKCLFFTKNVNKLRNCLRGSSTLLHLDGFPVCCGLDKITKGFPFEGNFKK